MAGHQFREHLLIIMRKIILIIGVALAAITTHAQSLLTVPPETPYQQAARETVLVLQGARNANLGIIRDGVGRTFGTDNHQAVMNILGNNARAAVEMYEGMVAWMTATMTAANDTAGLAELAAITARVPAYTKNADGTVTITQTPEPEE